MNENAIRPVDQAVPRFEDSLSQADRGFGQGEKDHGPGEIIKFFGECEVNVGHLARPDGNMFAQDSTDNHKPALPASAATEIA
jgi:hypothetical protein